MPSGSERARPPRSIGIIDERPWGSEASRWLEPDHASLLFDAFLRDTTLTVATVSGCRIYLISRGGADRSRIRRFAPIPVDIVEAPAEDVNRVNLSALGDVTQGAATVLLVSSAAATLAADILDRSFRTLECGRADIAAGPAEGGGLYLLAARSGQWPALDDIDWQGERAVEQVTQRAQASGLSVEVLPELSKATSRAGLERLVADLASDGAIPAPATRTVLATLRRLGAPVPTATTPWTLHSRKVVHESPWRSFVIDEVTTHKGETIDYSHLRAPDAVLVVPVTIQGNIVLIRQFRAPIGDWSLEVPAGIAEGTLEEAARVELREEVGGEAAELRYVCSAYPATGHASLRAHVFLALGVEPGASAHESTELIVPWQVPAALAFDLARHGEISDAMCGFALLACEPKVLEWLASRR